MSVPAPPRADLDRLLRLPRALRYLLLLAVLATALIYNRLALVEARTTRANSVLIETAEVLYVPDTRVMRLLFLGYDQAAADVLWLRTLSYFARHFLTDRRYQWLEHFVDQIIELDPRFRKVYHWAGTTVLYGRRFTNENVMISNRFYEKALARFPDDFEAAFRLGINYYVELKSDSPEARQRLREQGAQYLEMAANMPGAPPDLRSLVASLYTKLGKSRLAIQYLTELYLQTDHPGKREALRQRIAELSADVDMDAMAAEYQAIEAHRRSTFPYLSLGLFLLVEPEAAAAHPPVADWRGLLPHYEPGGAGPETPTDTPTDTPPDAPTAPPNEPTEGEIP